MSAWSLERTNELLADRGIEPRKSLGQNFVVDSGVIDRIVGLADLGPRSCVVEVGPGLGALTAALAQVAGRVVAVEKDESLIPVLREVLTRSLPSTDNIEVVAGDALDIEWSELLSRENEWVFVANLPYNVSVPVVLAVLERAPMVSRGLVMVQQEVAERLAAKPGGRTIGVPSVELSWYASAAVRDTIAPEAFHPMPNVDSALLEFHRREAPSDSVELSEVMSLVATAYRKRRKMLRSSLGGVLSSEAMERAGIEPTARPETLDVHDWVALIEQSRVATMEPGDN